MSAVLRNVCALLTWAMAVHAATPRIESAIFTCGYALFRPDDIPLLFPPTDISRNEIDDSSVAEATHRRSINAFCRHFDTYTSCVKQNLFYLPDDDIVKVYMDIDNFHRIFEFFCRNKNLIVEQFQCTRLSVWGRSCPYGGVYGIIAQVSQMIRQPISKAEFCASVQESIECRVTNQLASCHGKYADVMERIYHALVGKYCPSQLSTVVL